MTKPITKNPKGARPTGLAQNQHNQHNPKNSKVKTTHNKITPTNIIKYQNTLSLTHPSFPITNKNNKTKGSNINKNPLPSSNTTHIQTLNIHHTTPNTTTKNIHKYKNDLTQPTGLAQNQCKIKHIKSHKHLTQTYPVKDQSVSLYALKSTYPTKKSINQHQPTPKILSTPSTIINQSLTTRNHQPSKPPKQDWTSYLLNKMTNIKNTPKKHTMTPHTYILIRQQHIQQFTLYHKHHTYLNNLSKLTTLEKKPHHTHINKTLITHVPTIKPTQINLTKPTGARPTSLAHKKEIKYSNIKYHKNKKPHTSHNTYPKLNPLLTTNLYNRSTNYKTKRTSYIPNNIHKISSLHTHYNNKTPPPIQEKSKYHKQKQPKLTHKKHKIHLLLLRYGDIETNPGPMPNILTKHPPSHKQRNKIYFIPCTIKLQPKYQYLAKEFSPLLNTTHPRHLDSTITYPHLSRYIYLHQQHPPPRILYALITTISHSLATCNHQLIQTPNLDWTTSRLLTMTTLPNPPERHILTPHPYT